MQRRTFLISTAAGVALAAAPVGTLSTASATTAPATVRTLDELRAAINGAGPGDRIVVADGTYTVPADSPLLIRGKNGTERAPVTIAAQTRGGVVLEGEQSFVLEASSHITLSGFSFRQSTTLDVPPDCSHIRLTRNDFQLADIEGLHWVMVRADDSTIDHNHFHGKSTLGIYLGVEGAGTEEMAQRVHIYRNHFSDHTFTGSNGGEPIRLGVSPRALSSAQAVVEYNLFERCNGDPEAISVKSSDNTIRHNTIHNSFGGIVLRHGNRNRVEANHLVDGTEGVRIYGNDHVIVNNYLGGLAGRAMVIGSGSERDHLPGESPETRRGNDAPDRVLIAYNTLVNNAGTLSGESQRPHEPRDVTVADNLFVADTGQLVAMAATVRFTWSGNILWGAAADGNMPATGGVRTDPRLVTDAHGIARPAADSPAIDAGTLRWPPITHDIDGQPRGRLRDVGADEHSLRTPRRGPLTPADVGPEAA
ncbi:polysaccharide lyase 6 family protein [Streptomyces sp. VRA16 Mangrove soil]|uniref:polysaccharide lyase 6 family protein n=1 Tax=Streptomyces sp. VRA16 Mangrove soil TaxID=2817434 RepID=UPI001A9F7F96|nr:polysaccharide lyase 6 family protein [Streptomyces sp. VRA16 Mangrove soil]MBO1330455.1 polysaccharide lyase 6 family protein [Streptomyces sp. VRA16 Mangrove soil]